MYNSRQILLCFNKNKATLGQHYNNTVVAQQNLRKRRRSYNTYTQSNLLTLHYIGN